MLFAFYTLSLPPTVRRLRALTIDCHDNRLTGANMNSGSIAVDATVVCRTCHLACAVDNAETTCRYCGFKSIP